MTSLHPDHERLLALAQAAFDARDDRRLWNRDVTAAAERHGFYCDALWEELSRQVCANDGDIAVLEHPSVKRRTMIAQMRREIVAVAQNAMIEALDSLAHGPCIEEDDE